MVSFSFRVVKDWSCLYLSCTKIVSEARGVISASASGFIADMLTACEIQMSLLTVHLAVVNVINMV